MSHWSDRIRDSRHPHFSPDLIEWCRTQSDLATVWQVCQRGDWMMQLLLGARGYNRHNFDDHFLTMRHHYNRVLGNTWDPKFREMVRIETESRIRDWWKSKRPLTVERMYNMKVTTEDELWMNQLALGASVIREYYPQAPSLESEL